MPRGRGFNDRGNQDKSPTALRAALSAGADDVLVGVSPNPAQASHSLFRLSEVSHPEEGLNRKLVCSLVSVSGGGGVSHLATNLGLAFHRMYERRTVLVELDLQAAPLAVLLNEEPEHTIAELADPSSTIDSIRLESVLSKHESGLYWPGRPSGLRKRNWFPRPRWKPRSRCCANCSTRSWSIAERI